MNEARLRDELKRLGATQGPPPSFESVMAPARRRRRPRVARAAFAGASLFGALLVVLLVAKPDQPPRVASLALPPTTDWLLETPPANWMTKDPKKERPDET